MWRSANRNLRGERREAKGELRHTFHPSLFALLLLFLTSCHSVTPVVKIGLVGPFEGRYREVGYDVIYSARLAVREINQAGGIDDYRVALVALDDGGDKELARETAESLTLDPAVIVVVGHWLTQTTAVAAPIYAQADLPFIQMGSEPFTTFNPANLPPDFKAAYETVTPFDEQAGPYAGSTYDAFNLLWLALAHAAENGPITRQSVTNSLNSLQYEGLTGKVYWQLETGARD
jgi:branched-chain amino acid transport system substrate-binding protein